MKTVKLNKYPIVLPKKKAFIETPEGEVGLHACVVVCGARGSGKSIAVSSKLHHLKKEGLADRIFLISPTAISNSPMWEGLVEQEDIFTDMNNESVLRIVELVEAEAEEWNEYERIMKLRKKWRSLLHKRVPIDTIDPLLLMELMENGIMEMMEAPQSKYGHKPVLHIVLDDCQSSPLFVPSTKNKLLNITIRHRHIGGGLGVSLWFLVQSYSTSSGLPKAIRDNSTILVLFPMKNINNVAKIIQEVGGNIDEETFNKVYDFAIGDDPHSFLVIEFAPKDKRYTFRKKWDTLILP